MPGRTWKNVEADAAQEIRSYLLQNGGAEEKVTSLHEVWRIKFSDSAVTYYERGTLYSTPSNSKDPAVFKAWEQIDSVVGSAYALPTKDLLIGLDETGKGELIGHTVLTGAVFPKELFGDLDLLIGPADTKVRHRFGYWDNIFKELDRLRSSGLNFFVEKIPPWHVDRYNLNKIMDVSYQRILSILFREADISRCRIVLDDYGIGPTLKRFLNFLREQGAEVEIITKSEEKYLEAKVASVLSKRMREAVIEAINVNPEFQINGISVGSGNAGDRQTLDWLRKWHASGWPWPWFIKKSFQTVRIIEGVSAKIQKTTPPIREELLSTEFIKEFNQGNLSVKSLSLVCSSCGSVLKSAAFATFESARRKISELKCPNPDCDQLIRDAGMTLRYYCGYVIPDSTAIHRHIISNDLSASRFFENFSVVLVPVVRKECDGTPRGKRSSTLSENTMLWAE